MPTSACASFPIIAPPSSSVSTGQQGGQGSVRKSALSRLILNLLRWITLPGFPMIRQYAANSAVDLKFISRYDTDLYGRPRVLSRFEIILHAVAWPIVFGALAGFGLVIFFYYLPLSSRCSPDKQALILELNS